MADAAQGSQLRAKLSALRGRLENHDGGIESRELADLLTLLDGLLERVEVERHATAEQLHRYALEQSRLEERLARIENSLLFRSLRSVGFTLRSYKLRLGQIILKSPLHRLYLKLAPERPDPAYTQWIALRHAQTPSWEWHHREAQTWPNQPLISILMASHQPRREWLEAAIRSVLAQSYPFWELCVCDNGSPGWVAEYLEGQAAGDPRIRYHTSPEALGISGALNQAASLARGEYLSFLDHDDVLAPLALHYVAQSVQERSADAIYSDEDYLDTKGRRTRPSLKPDWSPDLLLDCMYFGHFFVVSRDRWEEAGGFRSEYDGAQDYDLALRLTERDPIVHHIPRILYHWRQHPESTAAGASAKPYTHDAGRRALQDAVRRRRLPADVLDGAGPNTYSLRWRLSGRARVSLILCSRNSKLLARCLRSLEPARRATDCQVVVVHHHTTADEGMEEVLRSYRCEVVPFRQGFNFARMNNLGVSASTGDVIVFLNDDVTPLTPDWLEIFLGHLQRPQVGVVGAKLVYPSGAIQHAGMVFGMNEGVGHPGRGIFHSDLWRWLDQTRNVSAVTGACMALRRQAFTGLGGFDIQFPVNYNDVDLCLRAREAGYQVICEPRAVLRHDECQTRTPGTRREERELFHKRWGELLTSPDPFYHPLLSLESEEIKLSLPQSAGGSEAARAATSPETGRVA